MNDIRNDMLRNIKMVNALNQLAEEYDNEHKYAAARALRELTMLPVKNLVRLYDVLTAE